MGRKTKPLSLENIRNENNWKKASPFWLLEISSTFYFLDRNDSPNLLNPITSVKPMAPQEFFRGSANKTQSLGAIENAILIRELLLEPQVDWIAYLPAPHE